MFTVDEQEGTKDNKSFSGRKVTNVIDGDKALAGWQFFRRELLMCTRQDSPGIRLNY
jgi:hypothetical protein